MTWITRHIKVIMLLSGIITCSMLYAAIAPQAALLQTFGVTLEGPAAEIVVRNWGALIALVGGMLIYGAYRPASRPLILTVACISKLIFITLVLVYGREYWGKAGVAVVFDAVVVLLFAGYLLTGPQPSADGL
jgi:hypothetical protein